MRFQRLICAIASPFLLHSLPGLAGQSASLETVGIYNVQDLSKKTEIISIQKTSQRLALSCSSKGIVDILSIATPAKPRLLHRLKVADGREISSVAFHPTENLFAVAVIHPDPFTAGSIQLHDADSGQLRTTLTAGVHPDSLAFSPDGRYLVAANEGEAYRYAGGHYESPEGSVTHVAFGDGLQDPVVTQISLEDYSDIEGMLHRSHARAFPREVIGGNSGEETEVPIRDNTSANTEPEYVAFSPDSTKAYVSLQENNGILVIDVATASIGKVFGLGMTEHPADIRDDGRVKFSEKLRALREPDGIAVSPDGRFVLTADEGDTDPKASKVLGNKPAGGGRTLSVFDAATGVLIADTGSQLDQAAHAAGLYPDRRSDNKGSEPESVVGFEIAGELHAAVALERANAIALVSLVEPERPRVISVEPVGPQAGSGTQYAPEGLAHYEHDGRHYVYSANEKSGTLTVMQVRTSDP